MKLIAPRSTGLALCSLAAALVLAACGTSDPPAQHGGGGGHHHGGGMPHRFEDPEQWAAVFDAPERDAWQQPDVVVERFATRKDLLVVDIGAGTGYFALRFARAVPDGKVIAVDIEPALLRHLEARAAEQRLGNVRTWVAAADDPQLEDWIGQVDLAFLCDTYHHIADRPTYFKKVAHALSRDGRLVVVDFELDSPRGPPREHKVGVEQVVAELAEAGFVLVGRSHELSDQYMLEFQKK